MARQRDEERYEATRDNILEVAAGVFRSEGYDRARLEDIASRVNVTKATIYYYFPKKSDLLLEICDRAVDESLLRQQAILSEDLPADQKLREAVAAHIRGMAVNHEVWNVFFRELEIELASHPKYAAVRQRLRAFGRNFESTIEEAIRDGNYRATNVRVVSNAILGMLNWSHRWIHEEDPDEVIEVVLDLVERGLRR